MTWPRVLPMPPCHHCGHRRLSHYTPQRFRMTGRRWKLTTMPAPCSVRNCRCDDYCYEEAS